MRVVKSANARRSFSIAVVAVEIFLVHASISVHISTGYQDDHGESGPKWPVTRFSTPFSAPHAALGCHQIPLNWRRREHSVQSPPFTGEMDICCGCDVRFSSMRSKICKAGEF